MKKHEPCSCTATQHTQTYNLSTHVRSMINLIIAKCSSYLQNISMLMGSTTQSPGQWSLHKVHGMSVWSETSGEVTVYATIPQIFFTERAAYRALHVVISLRVIPALTRPSRAYGHSEESLRDYDIHGIDTQFSYNKSYIVVLRWFTRWSGSWCCSWDLCVVAQWNWGW